ncbi:hypothetical protein BH11CYA1_BH11CYA1_25320 [soil metagenome]
MNILNQRVGQWLAILTVFVALGRGLYDAFLSAPDRVDKTDQIKIMRLERKLAAMQNSKDKPAKQKITKDLVQSYIDACQYAKAEPLVLQALSQAMPGDEAIVHAQALASCGDFYSNGAQIERAEICYMKAKDVFLQEKDFDGAANCCLSLARAFKTKAEVMSSGSARQATFSAAEKWLGEAVKIARDVPLAQPTRDSFRNTYLLLLAAEGRSDDLSHDLALENAKNI